MIVVQRSPFFLCPPLRLLVPYYVEECSYTGGEIQMFQNTWRPETITKIWTWAISHYIHTLFIAAKHCC